MLGLVQQPARHRVGILEDGRVWGGQLDGGSSPRAVAGGCRVHHRGFRGPGPVLLPEKENKVATVDK